MGGPERFRLDELVRHFLTATNDPRQVMADIHAPYYGLEVSDERALVPGGNPRVGKTRFADWLSRSATKPASSTPHPSEGAPA